MTYATQQNMIDRFGEPELVLLTDRARLGVLDAAVLAQALADADAEIDGYLAGRYALPLAAVPEKLALLACDLARFYLYKDAAPETVRDRQADAVKYLSLVGQGKIPLVHAGQAEAPQSGGVQFAAPGRVFGADTLAGY